MEIAIIIVSWNVKEKLRANLNALFHSLGVFKFTVLVVDNASSDGSADMVRTEFPDVYLIANQTNLGFAKASNQALELAEADFILLLNPDMLVEPDTIRNILDFARKNPQATVSGCRLINEKGKTIKQVRRFPRFFDQLMITLKIPHVFPAVLNNYLNVDFDYSEPGRVDSIRGAFFMINRLQYQKLSGLDKPFLDERYFIWFEEVDFCRQVYKLGGEVWYTPSAQCLDYVGASFSQVKRGKTQEYFCDSMLRYFQKWEPKWQYYFLKSVWRLVKIFVK